MLERDQGSNPTPYLTPVPTSTNNWVTQVIAYSTTTFTTIVDIAQSPAQSSGINASSGGLTPAQIGGIVGGILGFFLILGALLYCSLSHFRRSSLEERFNDSDSNIEYKPPAGPRPPDLYDAGVFSSFRRTTAHDTAAQRSHRVERSSTLPIVVVRETGQAAGWYRPPRRSMINRGPQPISDSPTESDEAEGVRVDSGRAHRDQRTHDEGTRDGQRTRTERHIEVVVERPRVERPREERPRGEGRR